MASFGNGSRGRTDGLVAPILSQGGQTTNCVIDIMVSQLRASRLVSGATNLYPTRKGDDEYEVVEVGYACFAYSGNGSSGTYPPVWNDWSNLTSECRKHVRFIGFPYATTETGMGYKAEKANAIGTIALQVGGLAPAWVNFQTLEAGTPVRYGDPYVKRTGDVVTDVYRAKGMTLENRIHATLRAATPPNWRKPAECGDSLLQADIEAANDLFKVIYSTGAGRTLEAGEIIEARADSWGNMLAASIGPGAFPSSLKTSTPEQLVDVCERYNIPQLMVSAVTKKFEASVIGVAVTHGTPGTQVALSF